MSNKLLMTRPDHDDTTFYLSEWAEEVKDIAENILGKKDVLDLKKERVTKKNFESMIVNNNPTLLFLNGHGDWDAVGGHKNEVILDLKNMQLLNSTVTYARSCRCAKILGFQAVKQGISRAFIGYKHDFIFPYDSRRTASPKNDTFCKHVLTASNLVAISLIRGKTPKEAFDASQQAYDFYIKRWVNSKEIEAPTILKYLIWDKANQVCFEN